MIRDSSVIWLMLVLDLLKKTQSGGLFFYLLTRDE